MQAHCGVPAASRSASLTSAPDGKSASDSIPRSCDDKRSCLDKALDLLSVFEGGQDGQGVSDLARRAGLTKSTAFRLLCQLEHHGFVERDGGRYRLGGQLQELGARVYEPQPGWLRHLVVPFMAELYELTHETVHLAVLIDTDLLCLEKLYGRRPVHSTIRPGARSPAYSTAVGKVLLAYDREAADRALAAGLAPRTAHTIVEMERFHAELARVRADGIAFDDEETLPYLTCVAAPILGSAGAAIAALSVAGAVPRFDPREHAHSLRAVACDATRAVRRAAPRPTPVSAELTGQPARSAGVPAGGGVPGQTSSGQHVWLGSHPK